MKRQTTSLVGILGIALLLSSVAVGCARRGGADATTAPSAPSASATAIVAAQPTDVPDPTETAPADATSEPTSADSPAASSVNVPANPTADPLDAQLQNVNQLLNGIDTSIAGSSGGGE